ncbi:MAG TPA: helix-turn-helix domain-containing protein [Acidimicrobiales bacterium]|nr:helix-turn-helix domain-containing protein [Acidimicrobiales bacterium]
MSPDQHAGAAALAPAREPGGRSRAESRDRLVAAAAELFSEHGYEQTTVREIGRRAGLDPTLIARYFGSKAALYLESLRLGSTAGDRPPSDLTDAGAVAEILERVRRNGLTPTLYAALRPHEDPELQEAATEVLRQRVTEPAEQRARRAGLTEPALRAELVTAALAGIVVSRTSQALSLLGAASAEEVAPLIAELIAHMTGELPAS